jgi:hypothetical protein
MSDSVPDGDQQQSLQTEMKERAELISVVLTTVLCVSSCPSPQALHAHHPGTNGANETSLQFTRSGVHDPRGLFQGLTGSSGPYEALHLAGIVTPLSRQCG